MGLIIEVVSRAHRLARVVPSFASVRAAIAAIGRSCDATAIERAVAAIGGAR